MSPVHFHLVINHFSVFAIPVALAFFIFSLRTKSDSARRFSLLALIVVAAMVVPTYFSGEEAEEVVEKFPGISEALIESHEDAGKIAAILTMITAALAVAALVTKDKLASTFNKLVIVSALVSIGGLFNAGRLGGIIRHPEIRSNGDSATSMEYDKEVEDRYEEFEKDHD